MPIIQFANFQWFTFNSIGLISHLRKFVFILNELNSTKKEAVADLFSQTLLNFFYKMECLTVIDLPVSSTK